MLIFSVGNLRRSVPWLVLGSIALSSCAPLECPDGFDKIGNGKSCRRHDASVDSVTSSDDAGVSSEQEGSPSPAPDDGSSANESVTTSGTVSDGATANSFGDASSDSGKPLADASLDGAVATMMGCEPLTIANGTVSGGTSYDETATYKCNVGYAFAPLVGDISRRCGPDMQWSGSAPRCDVVDCLSLPAPENGLIMYAGGTTYMGQATYKCISGYSANSSSLSRTCDAMGHWTGTAPTCIAKCGNGVMDPGELCDPSTVAWNPWTCSPTCLIKRQYNACNPVTGAECGGNACLAASYCTYMCSTNTDCPTPTIGGANAVCTFGSCALTDCTTNADCPTGTICKMSGSNRVCSGCMVDQDCPTNQLCKFATAASGRPSTFGLCTYPDGRLGN